jgi:hypothetical protein
LRETVHLTAKDPESRGSETSAHGRFCCRSRLRRASNGDSVCAGRFSAEAHNDGAAQPGSRATFLFVLPC